VRLTEDQYEKLQEKLSAEGKTLKDFVCDHLDVGCEPIDAETSTVMDADDESGESLDVEATTPPATPSVPVRKMDYSNDELSPPVKEILEGYNLFRVFNLERMAQDLDERKLSWSRLEESDRLAVLGSYKVRSEGEAPETVWRDLARFGEKVDASVSELQRYLDNISIVTSPEGKQSLRYSRTDF
jgi:hypothetical protein